MKRRPATQRHRERAAERRWLRDHAEAEAPERPRRERRAARELVPSGTPSPTAGPGVSSPSRRALGRVSVPERTREAEALRVRCHICGVGFVAVTELLKHRATHEAGAQVTTENSNVEKSVVISSARVAAIAAGLITPAGSGDDAA